MRRRFTAGEQVAKGLEQAAEVGECLEWPGPFSCRGATPCVKVRMDGANYSDNVPVCRVLWEQAYGPIPEGRLIYRTCCNNACVCLDHLSIGTRKQWMAHRKRAGKTKHKMTTKLNMTVAARKRPTVVNTLEKARQVRELMGTMTRKEIAAATGVSYAMVCDICEGSCWRETISNPFSGLLASNDTRKAA